MESTDYPWWEDSEAVVMVAEYLVNQGASGRTILRAFQEPWDFSTAYDAAVSYAVHTITGEDL